MKFALLDGADLIGAVLAGATNLGDAYGSVSHDASTDFTGTGFDPVRRLDARPRARHGALDGSRTGRIGRQATIVRPFRTPDRDRWWISIIGSWRLRAAT
jgi:hypothetical protein